MHLVDLGAVLLLYAARSRRYISEQTEDEMPRSGTLGHPWQSLWGKYRISPRLCGGGCRTNDVSDYANVFLPCNVNGVVYTKENATIAPEACIYRHSAKFGSAVSQVMQDNYLTGGCNVTSGALNCRTKSSGEGPGRDKFLESLYSKVDVEDPHTRFGSSEYDADKVRNNVALPLGTASGVVWRTTVCTSVELQWMGLPVAIVVLTASLLGWGLRQSWRARRTQPVWKDSVLPLLCHQELLQPSDHLTAEAEPGQVLMEVNDMEKLAKDVSVVFHWPSGILVPES